MKARKHLTLTVLLIAIANYVTAQEEQVKSIRPGKNNFTFEVDFTPFNSTTPVDLHGFRGRFFLSDKLAIRTGFNFDMKTNYEELPSERNGIVLFESDDEQYTVFGINTGIEYHFLPSGRVSPYFGAGIGFENKSSHADYEDVVWDYSGPSYSYYLQKTEIENCWLGYELYYDPNYGYYFIEDFTNRAYNKLSGFLILGADVNIVKHFYMGVELGLGVDLMTYKEISVKIDGEAQPTIPEAKETDYGLIVNNAIRLGFWF